jgi:hypothetical protein
MPRINIEDEFFIDAGRVGAKLGDYDRALGMALGWIKFGQDKFKAGKKITRQEFLNRFSEALIPEFATFKGDFVEVVGADKHFSWLLKKQEAGAAGGSVSSDAKKQAAIEREKRPQAKSRKHKPLPLSLPLPPPSKLLLLSLRLRRHHQQRLLRQGKTGER